MTVCVAAICDDSRVIGASDRMFTADDIQFEPPQTKHVYFSRSITGMIAGDSAFVVEIMLKVRADVQERITRYPNLWWRVEEVAELYRKYFNECRNKRAEQTVLAPLGLTYDSFYAGQQNMSSRLVTEIATELLNYRPPAVQVIFAGNDVTGVHIYVADNGNVTCHDGAGFAAIGVGYWHANSQFMFSAHSRYRSLSETLLLCYSAKKRAEVAPGVGEFTDMFMIGPELGSYVAIGDHVLSELERIHKLTLQAHAESEDRAKEMIQRYVEELARQAAPQGQQPPKGGEASAAPQELPSPPAGPEEQPEAGNPKEREGKGS